MPNFCHLFSLGYSTISVTAPAPRCGPPSRKSRERTPFSKDTGVSRVRYSQLTFVARHNIPLGGVSCPRSRPWCENTTADGTPERNVFDGRPLPRHTVRFRLEMLRA